MEKIETQIDYDDNVFLDFYNFVVFEVFLSTIQRKNN